MPLCHKLQPTYIWAWSFSVHNKTLRGAAAYKWTNRMCVVCFTLRNIVHDWFRGPWRLANSLFTRQRFSLSMLPLLLHARRTSAVSHLWLLNSQRTVETQQLIRDTQSITTSLSWTCHDNSSHRKHLELFLLAFLIAYLTGLCVHSHLEYVNSVSFKFEVFHTELGAGFNTVLFCLLFF